MIKKIVSGGQTGADQAALDAALKFGISHGGWISEGRQTENGPLDIKYKLIEIPGGRYIDRTEKNVEDSNGTLIASHGELNGGSEYTRTMAIKHNRPWIHIDLNRNHLSDAAHTVFSWIKNNKIEVLNVAGPRLSKEPSIYREVTKLLENLFLMCK